MASPSRLLTVSSATEAMGVYVPAMIVQKAVGLGRLVLLAYLMSHVPHQYGMWGIGMMVATLVTPVLAMGLGHGLRRYASRYRARGQLGAFYRRMRWLVPLGCAAVACIALACSGAITRGVIVSKAQAAEIDLPYGEQLALCVAALANAAVMAVYQCVLGFTAGLRAYRLVSVVEVFFSVLFTIVAGVVLAFWPTGLAVLWAHLAVMVVSLVAAGAGLDALVRQLSSGEGPAPRDHWRGMLGRLVRFGLGAMSAALCLVAAEYVSLYMINRWEGKVSAGVYALFAQLSRPMFLVACAFWTVILTHSANLWEAGNRDEALGGLQTGYKAVAAATMTLTVALLAAAPLWVGLLPESFRGGVALLGGLLMFFQSLTHLAVMNIVARLHERPGAVAAAMLVGGAVNAVLAWRWLGPWGLAGASWAAGLGMYAGGGAVAVAYLLITRTRLGAGTYVILAAPVLLALSIGGLLWAPAAAWAVVLGGGLATNRLFSAEEKRLLARRLRGLWG